MARAAGRSAGRAPGTAASRAACPRTSSPGPSRCRRTARGPPGLRPAAPQAPLAPEADLAPGGGALGRRPGARPGVAPSRTGKSFHATDVLLRFPGPAIAVDPKGELWQRTAGARAARAYGPVWRIPDAGVDLARLFDLSRDLDRREVFQCLWRPWQDGADGRIFTERTYPLLAAAAVTGRAHRRSTPSRCWPAGRRTSPARPSPRPAQHAPAEVAVLTDGTPLDALQDNRFFLSSWGTFTTKFGPLAEQARHPHPASGRRAGCRTAGPAPAARSTSPTPCTPKALWGRSPRPWWPGSCATCRRTPPTERALLLLDEAPAVGLPAPLDVPGHHRRGGRRRAPPWSTASRSRPLEAVYGAAEAEGIASNASLPGLLRAPQPQDGAVPLAS